MEAEIRNEQQQSASGEYDPANRDDYWRYLASMNPDHFRELMNAYGKDVWNYAYFLTRRPELADDITQDVFLKVYRNFCEFQGASSVKTWLLAITRNVTVSYRRSAYFRKVILMEWIVPTRNNPSAEQDAMENALQDEVWKLVMKLPVKFREVLILDARYEMTYREIASVLGISEGTVKSRLSRARSKVTAMWKEVPEDGRA